MAGSSGSVKRFYRVFLAWQEKEEEEWLAQMAGRGWHLRCVNGIVYTFQRRAPEKVAYRLDFKATSDADFEEYLQLYRDFGWEFVTRYGNWVYFRRPADAGPAAELYTDNRSKIERYRSQLRVMAAAGAPLWVAALVVFPMTTISFTGWWALGMRLFLIAAAAAYLYALTRILAVIRKLEENPRE